jgi:hypothetical protein
MISCNKITELKKIGKCLYKEDGKGEKVMKTVQDVDKMREEKL